MISRISINEELRPCLISNTTPSGGRYCKKGLFHRWVPFENLFDPFCKDKVKGLIEYEDGTMDYIWASNIRFLDPRHCEYDFSEKGNDNGMDN